ncbi:unnamed protein product [Clonostachys rosea]|uniref:NAD-dependent epimerase/dehydratase domain-containing protein n=1 Tax=Bionectria ochroleuca TaxID=29856 RepID=A0ABY6UBR1_BIOOC|nr:unnamed protein product [Clonostachys rosea]
MTGKAVFSNCDWQSIEVAKRNVAVFNYKAFHRLSTKHRRHRLYWGDFLYEVYRARPAKDISVLIRSDAAAASIQEAYPGVRVVRGNLDSGDLLRDEAQRADVVLHFANCDHENSARALLEGLARHTEDRPGWYIHTSGTGILTFEDGRAKTYGIRRERVFNDWSGVGELISLPDDSFHRNVDSIVTATIGDVPKTFKTAIVCPCCIYGEGRGPGNRSSTQVYTLATQILQRGKGFVVGKGENVWHYVHIRDLSKLFLLLTDTAISGGGNATWDSEGYYFAESGNITWGEISQKVTQAAFAKGYIETAYLDVLDWDTTEELDPKGPYRWGSNSRGQAIRGNKLLGWKPEQPTLLECIGDIVDLQKSQLE